MSIGNCVGKMTVGELIRELNKLPPDDVVAVYDNEIGLTHVDRVSDCDIPGVWLIDAVQDRWGFDPSLPAMCMKLKEED